MALGRGSAADSRFRGNAEKESVAVLGGMRIIGPAGVPQPKTNPAAFSAAREQAMQPSALDCFAVLAMTSSV